MDLVNKLEFVKSIKVFLVVTYYFYQVDVTAGVCCSNTGRFSCCGKGPAGCNIFCCNCDGNACRDGCRYDWTLGLGDTIAHALGKRDVNGETYRSTETRFNLIDNNLDGYLDLKESVAWLSSNLLAATTTDADLDRNMNLSKKLSWLSQNNATKVSTGRNSISYSPEWFQTIDTNSDGFISPNEFDRNL